jgi:putative DNA-invertase from lambdoid prophage Rac
MKVALYARISTRDQQTIPMQIEAMSSYASSKGWKVANIYQEAESGKKDDRPVRAELLKLAAKRKFDAVMVWKLDRWGRSTIDILTTMMELHTRGIAFVSLSEAIDLTTPMGRMMAQMLAVFAEFEREQIVERVRAGVNRYREQNAQWGRPATAKAKADEVKKLWDGGLKNKKAIAQKVGISRASVFRVLQRRSNNQ